MTEEPWNKHTPADREALVEVLLDNDLHLYLTPEQRNDIAAALLARGLGLPTGVQPNPADPYNNLEWDEDDTAIVALKKPGQPEWVRGDDMVRFRQRDKFEPAKNWTFSWVESIAFQIKRRPVPTHAVPQLLLLLSEATGTEANAIRQAARRANIEVPE